MRKTTLLNSNLSTVISTMGHFDTLCIGDAGLPIPKDVARIDLAVSAGVPTFLQVLDAVNAELCVQKVTVAMEIKKANPTVHEAILERFPNVEIQYVPHENFKRMTENCKAVARTGETSSYANIILESGVTF